MAGRGVSTADGRDLFGTLQGPPPPPRHDAPSEGGGAGLGGRGGGLQFWRFAVAGSWSGQVVAGDEGAGTRTAPPCHLQGSEPNEEEASLEAGSLWPLDVAGSVVRTEVYTLVLKQKQGLLWQQGSSSRSSSSSSMPPPSGASRKEDQGKQAQAAGDRGVGSQSLNMSLTGVEFKCDSHVSCSLEMSRTGVNSDM
jgi:hypothetical protein